MDIKNNLDRQRLVIKNPPEKISKKSKKPSREEVELAIHTLLLWAGEDPTREGLRDTPKRVALAYEDWFGGYKENPVRYLQKTFKEVDGYDEMIVLRDITFESHCEHHMTPIIGKVHVGYLPNNKIVGISKLARVVEPGIVHQGWRVAHGGDPFRVP